MIVINERQVKIAIIMTLHGRFTIEHRLYFCILERNIGFCTQLCASCLGDMPGKIKRVK